MATESIDGIVGDAQGIGAGQNYAAPVYGNLGSLVMYTMDLGIRPMPEPFRPLPPLIRMDGDVVIDLKRSTDNTAILKQLLEGLDGPLCLYVHHNNGPGRMEEVKILKSP